MEPFVTLNPMVMHGAACFARTRVPASNFCDHLEAGYTIDGFLEQFPTVRREQVLGLLGELRERSAGQLPAVPAAPGGVKIEAT